MYFKNNFIFLLKRKTGVTIGRSNLNYELVSLLLLGTLPVEGPAEGSLFVKQPGLAHWTV